MNEAGHAIYLTEKGKAEKNLSVGIVHPEPRVFKFSALMGRAQQTGEDEYPDWSIFQGND